MGLVLPHFRARMQKASGELRSSLRAPVRISQTHSLTLVLLQSTLELDFGVGANERVEPDSPST